MKNVPAIVEIDFGDIVLPVTYCRSLAEAKLMKEWWQSKRDNKVRIRRKMNSAERKYCLGPSKPECRPGPSRRKLPVVV